MDLGLHAIFGGYLLREGFELGLGAGDEEDVEPFRGELEGEFFADAVRGAGNYCPGALGTEFTELCI